MYRLVGKIGLCCDCVMGGIDDLFGRSCRFAPCVFEKQRRRKSPSLVLRFFISAVLNVSIFFLGLRSLVLESMLPLFCQCSNCLMSSDHSLLLCRRLGVGLAV